METFDIIRTIFTEFPYALWGSVLVGIICGFLGVYIVARRVVFLGAVLTQVSLLGLALSFLPVLGAIPHTVTSLIVTLITVIVISRLLTGKKIPRDGVLGFVFVSSVAARILIMQKAPKVEASEIENLLRGDVLFVTPEPFYMLAAAFVVAMILYTVFSKEFRYISFDAETAQTQGFNTGFWEMFFYLIAAAVITFATHVVGDVFVFGFLVAPPLAGMLLATRVRSIFIVAMVIGALAPVAGLFIAFKYDFPSSPAVVAVASAILAGAWVISVMKKVS